MHSVDVYYRRSNNAWKRRCHSVTLKAYCWRFIRDVFTMHKYGVSISDVLTKHGDNVFLSDIQSLQTLFYQWRSNNARRRRFYQCRCYKAWIQCCYQWHSKLREDVLSVTLQQCMETTFYQWCSNNAWRRRFISDVLTMHGDDVSISDIQSLESKFYQWRSNNAWRRRFISDVLTKHAYDVVLVTFKT